MKYTLVPNKPVLVVGLPHTFKSTIGLLVIIDQITKRDDSEPKTIWLLGESISLFSFVIKEWTQLDEEEWKEKNNVNVVSIGLDIVDRLEILRTGLSTPSKHYVLVENLNFFSHRSVILKTVSVYYRNLYSELSEIINGCFITCICKSVDFHPDVNMPSVPLVRFIYDAGLSSITGTQLFTKDESTSPSAVFVDGDIDDIGKELTWK